MARMWSGLGYDMPEPAQPQRGSFPSVESVQRSVAETQAWMNRPRAAAQGEGYYDWTPAQAGQAGKRVWLPMVGGPTQPAAPVYMPMVSFAVGGQGGQGGQGEIRPPSDPRAYYVPGPPAAWPVEASTWPTEAATEAYSVPGASGGGGAVVRPQVDYARNSLAARALSDYSAAQAAADELRRRHPPNAVYVSEDGLVSWDAAGWRLDSNGNRALGGYDPPEMRQPVRYESPYVETRRMADALGGGVNLGYYEIVPTMNLGGLTRTWG